MSKFQYRVTARLPVTKPQIYQEGQITTYKLISAFYTIWMLCWLLGVETDEEKKELLTWASSKQMMHPVKHVISWSRKWTDSQTNTVCTVWTALMTKWLTFHFLRAANFLNFSMLTADSFLLSACWVSFGWFHKQDPKKNIILTL